MPRKPKQVSRAAECIVRGVEWLKQTSDGDTPQERVVTCCTMLDAIRSHPDEIEFAEQEPIAHLGKYINEQARCGDAVHLCGLVGKVRAVETGDSSSMLEFYTGMLNQVQGRHRLLEDISGRELVGSSDLKPWIKASELKLLFLEKLEIATRERVSACAADDLQEYVRLLRTRVDVVIALHRE